VGILASRDEEFRIENVGIEIFKVSGLNRIHVVYQRHVSDVKSLDPKIPSFISSQDEVPNLLPFGRRVEPLIQIAIEAECARSDLSSQSQVVESLLKGGESNQLTVCP
jgi:hypothetical protein